MKFTPEDFNCLQSDGYSRQFVASEVANAKLKEWLDAAPVVEAASDAEGSWYAATEAPEFAIVTHTAKLVCIEPLK